MSTTSVHVVLVQPEIPWNTGNAGRTCLAAGARLHLVGPCGFALDERELRRAGLDYWPRVEPRIWSDWPEFEARLVRLGDPYLFSAEAPRDIYDLIFSDRPVLIFGCESVGLPRDLRSRYADRLVRIPMADPALRSINLSTAIGIALYEVVRQRRAAGRDTASGPISS